jgi:hypothetical protein
MKRRRLNSFVALALAGLAGCQTMKSEHQLRAARSAAESGFSNVIQAVPEPGPTWPEQSGKTGHVRRGKVYGRSSAAVAPEIPPLVENDPGRFPVTTPAGTETGFAKNPTTDVPKASPAVALKPSDGPYRAITEAEVRQLAAGASRPAYRLELESIIPASHVESRYRRDDCASPVVERFMNQARELTARGERIKQVGEAASAFYQLADVEGQAELLRAGVAAFDQMRSETAKPRTVNGRTIAVPAEMLAGLDRQRADLLKNAELLAFACANANIDLKKHAGLSGHTTDRLYPTGEFGIDPTPVDIEAAVRAALENRPDLQMLRLAYYELNEDTLPAIRDQLKAHIGLIAPPRLGSMIAGRHRPWIQSALEKFGHKSNHDPALAHELAVRKAQLHDLICEKERDAADQVRKAAHLQMTAANIVGTLRWKSDSLKSQVDAAKTNKELLLLEWYKARAEVVSAVMTWHQARVKLAAAQGTP